MKLTAKDIVTLSYPKNYTPENEQSKNILFFSFYKKKEDELFSQEKLDKERWDELTEKNKAMLSPLAFKINNSKVTSLEDSFNSITHRFLIKGTVYKAKFHRLNESDDIEWKLSGYYTDEEYEKVSLKTEDGFHVFTEFDNCSLIIKAEITTAMNKWKNTHLRSFIGDYKKEFNIDRFFVGLNINEKFYIECAFESLKIIISIDESEMMFWDSYDHLFDRIIDTSRLILQNRDLLRI